MMGERDRSKNIYHHIGANGTRAGVPTTMTENDYRELLDRIAALQQAMASQLAGDIALQPAVGEGIVKLLDDLMDSVIEADKKAIPPPDLGLGQLAGIGPDATDDFGQTRVPPGVEPYDETVTSERLIAVGDLYYIYQHEKIGVFRVVQKLQELFRGGAIRLSSGPGAFALYQFDRREVLRYTRRDRAVAYRRVLGYGSATVPPGSRPNTDFHHLFTHFANQVALFWRDKRISDVMRERAYDPSFGSIAIVRRAGLDLRNNLKHTSYGNLNVLRAEVMQLLDEAFRILSADDIRRQFGADTAWDVIEEVLVRHFNERLETSPRQRMGVAGREILHWMAQPHMLQTQRAPFEALLLSISEYAEEWLTSAQALGLANRRATVRVNPAVHRPRPTTRRAPSNGATPAARELAYELEI